MKWAGGTPVLSPGSGAIDIFSIWYDGSAYFGVAAQGFV
jgi:hypothetical protein